MLRESKIATTSKTTTARALVPKPVASIGVERVSAKKKNSF